MVELTDVAFLNAWIRRLKEETLANFMVLPESLKINIKCAPTFRVGVLQCILYLETFIIPPPWTSPFLPW